ncbi:hypothetical protein QCE62_07085 [Caballeronia sp. LZ033]|uniref:hypothetical protein n=1 Tax=Caballeronia sp. LZ033 TaxID=3038566 RepID=UPI00285B9C2D|nr:hypothetical protein [Caballeronia sp. LZ033]MDR5813356.1 hypothetical protein [Caballeronia sp. LZ033]
MNIVAAWGVAAFLFVLFIRGACESAASSIHELHEPSPDLDDAGHDACARAGVVDVA